MSISLHEAIGQAQTAFDSGDYRSAVETCSRIIDQYPHYTSAQRLLGQAYLEQGQPAEAESWFARLLAHDPREADAYLGLGLIAEDRGVIDHALAYCQVAWELSPEQARYRDTITRIAERRYGSDGRLRLTHAALARIHANAWRLRRAVKEYQSALIALPDRIDLWMGLAEVLWLLGEDTDAAEIAREFLKDHSELMPALVILADIEHRRGDAAEAERYRERLRHIDPDGVQTAAMVARNPRADASFFTIPPEEQPTVVERVDAIVSERPQFAPAPDFTFQPENTEQAELDELQPISPEEFTGELPPVPAEPTTSSFVPETYEENEEPDTVEVEMLDPAAVEGEQAEAFITHDNDDEIQQIEDQLLSEGMAAIRDDEAAEPAEAADLEAQLLDLSGELAPFPEQDELALEGEDIENLLEDLEGIEPMSLDEFGAADEPPATTPGFFEDAEIDFDIRIEDPDAVQIGGGPPKVAPGFFAGGATAFGSGSDDFPELPDVEDDAPATEDDRPTMILDDDAIEAMRESAPQPAQEPAAPPEPQITHIPSGTGFTRLLGELGNEGLAPFDPTRTAIEGAPATPDASGDVPAIPSLADGWDDIDAELASATPGGSDAADELLDIDELGLEPFTLDDEDMDFVTSVQPAAMDPHSIATLPLEPAASDAAQGAAQPAEEAANTVDMEDVPGLEPFDIEDFEDINEDTPFEFGVLPWERQDGTPNGLDIDSLLEDDASEALAPFPERQPEPLLDFGSDPFGMSDQSSVDPSMDITRELGSGAIDPNFAHRMAEVEAAARENLNRMQREQRGEPVQPVPAAEVGALPSAPSMESLTDLLSNPTAERLAANADIFERSRSAKDALVDQGVIRGDRELAPAAGEVEAEPSADAQPEAAVEAEAEPAWEPPAVPAPQMAVDIDALRARLEQDPHDADARWQLAEALRERGEIHAAFSEYRWLIRHAPARHDDVIGALELCAYNDIEADLAHRLLADLYRRRGDSAQARNHASLAMATRRLMREIRM